MHIYFDFQYPAVCGVRAEIRSLGGGGLHYMLIPLKPESKPGKAFFGRIVFERNRQGFFGADEDDQILTPCNGRV